MAQITLNSTGVASNGALVLQSNGTTTAVTIDTSQRAAFVAGTAALPAITTTGNTNTGIFFPAADTIAFTEGGAEAARIDSSGNLMVGQTSATGVFSVTGAGASNTGIIAVNATDTSSSFVWAQQSFLAGQTAGQNFINMIGKASSTRNAGYMGYKFSSSGSTSNLLTFGHYGADNLMNLDGSGNLLVGATSTLGSTAGILVANSGANVQAITTNSTSSSAYYIGRFYSGGVEKGYIYFDGTNVSYTNLSDYRLKENVQPMQNALDKVAQLNPVTYNWKSNGKAGHGFIAHELKAVVPDCVTGDKDAVDEEGNPKYQGVDTSFLVATLTAAIQEQQALITQLTARLDAANL
jgi:hypothetical protein